MPLLLGPRQAGRQAGRQLMRDTLGKYIDADAVEDYESELEDKRSELEASVQELLEEKFRKEMKIFFTGN